MRAYVAAIDQGTTSTRFMVFDRAGRVVTSAQKEHRQIFPQPGWVEHDPTEIWLATLQVIEQALRAGGLDAQDLAAVGITNQRETVVLWDRATGAPVANAIVWQDTRTAARCDELARGGGGDRFRAKTGLPIATYFSGTKLGALVQSSPELQRRAGKGELAAGTIDTWLLWNLTGGAVHATDVSNASRTQLFDIQRLDWDDELLDTMGVPRAILPAIRDSSGVVGAAGGLLEGVPIAGILGDQQAALFGQACFAEGEAKNTYGTGCFLLLNTGSRPVPSRHGLLTTVGWRMGGRTTYCLEGSVAIAGAAIQWLRDNLGLIRETSDVEGLARSVEDHGGVHFVPAFSGLYAPYWRSDARGVISGLTRYARAGHIARAALEATAFQTREVLDAMQADASLPLTALKVDGGMVKNELLMQFQADILGIPVVCPQVTETTALGAAYAAGLAVALWSGTDELRAQWRAAREWQPILAVGERESRLRDWRSAVRKTFA